METEDWPTGVGERGRGRRPCEHIGLSGLNKASLDQPPRSPHPNYTPDTSTLLHLFSRTPPPPHPVPSSDQGSTSQKSVQRRAAGGVRSLFSFRPDCFIKLRLTARSIATRFRRALQVATPLYRLLRPSLTGSDRTPRSLRPALVAALAGFSRHFCRFFLRTPSRSQQACIWPAICCPPSHEASCHRRSSARPLLSTLELTGETPSRPLSHPTGS